MIPRAPKNVMNLISPAGSFYLILEPIECSYRHARKTESSACLKEIYIPQKEIGIFRMA